MASTTYLTCDDCGSNSAEVRLYSIGGVIKALCIGRCNISDAGTPAEPALNSTPTAQSARKEDDDAR